MKTSGAAIWRLLQELKRRRVPKVVALYLLASWAAIEVADTVLPNLGAAWIVPAVIVLSLTGFVPVVVISWFYDLTADGVIREPGVLPQPRSRYRRLALTASGVSLMVPIILTSWAFEHSRRRDSFAVDAPLLERRPAIAVFPFDVAPDVPQPEILAHALADEVIRQLIADGRIDVIARLALVDRRDPEASPREIAAELGASAVLLGVVDQVSGGLRIAIELIDVSSGKLIHSFGVEDVDERAAGREIAAVARRVLGGGAADVAGSERPLTESSAAYREYRLGRYHAARGGRVGLHSAIEHFERAIEEDPVFARALAELALMHLTLAGHAGEVDAAAAAEEAREYAERALEIDSASAEAHSVMGFYWLWHQWDWSASKRHLDTALEIDQQSTMALETLVEWFSYRGRHAEAIATAQRLVELEPTLIITTAAANYRARRFRTAESYARSSLDLDSASSVNHLILGLTLLELGDEAEALTHIERAVLHSGNTSGTQAFLAGALARVGQRDSSLALLSRVESSIAAQPQLSGVIAHVHAWLGNADSAFFWLERAIEVRSNYVLPMVAAPGRLDPVSNDPRMDDVLRRVGLQRAEEI